MRSIWKTGFISLFELCSGTRDPNRTSALHATRIHTLVPPGSFRTFKYITSVPSISIITCCVWYLWPRYIYPDYSQKPNYFTPRFFWNNVWHQRIQNSIFLNPCGGQINIRRVIWNVFHGKYCRFFRYVSGYGVEIRYRCVDFPCLHQFDKNISLRQRDAIFGLLSCRLMVSCAYCWTGSRCALISEDDDLSFSMLPVT